MQESATVMLGIPVRETTREAHPGLISHGSDEQTGMAVCLYAQKEIMVYFIKNFDALAGYAYKQSLRSMPKDPNRLRYIESGITIENIFESSQTWEAFKSKYFNVGKEVKHYIDPWLQELDRMVEKMEETDY